MQIVWDVESGETRGMLEGHTLFVNAVAKLDEKRVVSASDDKTLRVWDVESGETIRTLKGHTKGVDAVAVLGKKCVVSASSDQTLRVWDVESDETIRTLEGHTDRVLAVAKLDEKRVVSASSAIGAVAALDEKRVVLASGDRTLRVWDVESGETMAVFALDAQVSSVAVTTDGRMVVAGDEAGGVHFLDFDLSCMI